MNDDHYLLQHYEASEFPYYCQGLLTTTLKRYDDRYPYRKVLCNTLSYLDRFGLSAIDFDVHCPIIYNKKKFGEALPVTFPKHGYAIKSIYGNCYKIQGIFSDDLKFNDKQSMWDILKILDDRGTWFSIGNRCLKGAMPNVLHMLYPNKSRYEL